MKNQILFILGALTWSAGAASAAVNVQPNGDKFYTAVQDKGPSEQKYDIVFIGDGFTAAEQNIFNSAVDQAVNALASMTPYRERKMCWANIWRVNVISPQSGVDHPKDGIYKNSELDCRYGNPAWGEPERLIQSDSSWKCYEAANHAPAADAVFVLVNDPQWGGAAGGLVFSSIHPGDTKHPGGFPTIVTHELGHKIGQLADEYSYYYGPDIDGNQTYSGPEPSAVNVTKQTILANIKWKDLISPGTPIPTINSSYNTVGLWEGGYYKAHGAYRPQTNCHMRAVEADFCAVCEDQMRKILATHCADCDEEPLHPECFFPDLFKHFRFISKFRCKFPFPHCPYCPVGLTIEEEIIYVLEGAPAGARVQILDEKGEVVARGVAEKGQLTVKFNANKTKQYFATIEGDAGARGAALLRSSLFRNGVEQQLPEQQSLQ